MEFKHKRCFYASFFADGWVVPLLTPFGMTWDNAMTVSLEFPWENKMGTSFVILTMETALAAADRINEGIFSGLVSPSGDG